MTMLLYMGLAFFIGVVIGWAWKPIWVRRMPGGLSPQHRRRCSGDTSNVTTPITVPISPTPATFSGNQPVGLQNSLAVTEEDLRHLAQLVELKDEGSPWIFMMEHSTSSMSYQAWRRDAKSGPPQYRSRTVYEDASAELVRDFLWDDDFRLGWDDMLVHAKTIEECTTTGTMIVHWIRKFPFFCSNREYIIGRRIWVDGKTYYCVTKGVPSSSIQKKTKPRRVDLYYSSWFIRAVESRRGDGQPTACEVTFFHHEEMGIPWEIAGFGVKHGMWGTALKIERGLRAYQIERALGVPLTRPAYMAQIHSKASAELLKYVGSSVEPLENEIVSVSQNLTGRNIQKLLIFGGAVVIACSLDRGFLSKAAILGMGKRFADVMARI